MLPLDALILLPYPGLSDSLPICSFYRVIITCLKQEAYAFQRSKLLAV